MQKPERKYSSLAISETSWFPGEEDEALSFLSGTGISGIVLSLPRLLSSSGDVRHISATAGFRKRRLKSFGKSVVAVSGFPSRFESMSLFGPKTERQALIRWSERVGDIVAQTGTDSFLFEAPTLRRVSLSHKFQQEAEETLVKMAEMMWRSRVSLHLVPVPPCRGGALWKNTTEISDVIFQAGLPFLSMTLETTSLFTSDPTPRASLVSFSGSSRFLIVSEPFWGSLDPDGPIRHGKIAKDLGRLSQFDRVPEFIVLSQERLRDGKSITDILSLEASVFEEIYGS